MDMYDCIVVGGGMVGAASALSLAELGLTVAVVEQKKTTDFTVDQPFDLRVSAISLASEHLLTQLDAWPKIVAARRCAYSRLGVWEETLAYTEFNAKSIGQSHLGHIIENRLIQLALWEKLTSHNNVTLFCPDKLLSFEQTNDAIDVALSSGQLTTKLLIGADGANSQVRALANIGLTGWDYQQSAMLINVETAHAQENITWQQFYPSGPVAMLPLAGKSELGGYASLVWYHHRDEIKRLSLLSNQALQDEVLQHFPKRLGNIKVLDKAAFPLTRRHANHYQKNRVLLLGDAAHTINPMAGQGVNLGFKDVKALHAVIATAIAAGKCWHDPDVLSGYEKARRKDNLLMMSMMDMLSQAFSHPSPLVKIARNTGLFLANNISSLKKKALAYACGV
jgi:3-demethoxyubiquinol 3-hydroxylase